MGVGGYSWESGGETGSVGGFFRVPLKNIRNGRLGGSDAWRGRWGDLGGSTHRFRRRFVTQVLLRQRRVHRGGRFVLLGDITDVHVGGVLLFFGFFGRLGLLLLFFRRRLHLFHRTRASPASAHVDLRQEVADLFFLERQLMFGVKPSPFGDVVFREKAVSVSFKFVLIFFFHFSSLVRGGGSVAKPRHEGLR